MLVSTHLGGWHHNLDDEDILSCRTLDEVFGISVVPVYLVETSSRIYFDEAVLAASSLKNIRSFL